MALQRDAPHTRSKPLLLLCLGVSCFLSPWAASSSVSRKLRNEEELQYLQYLEHPQTQTNRFRDSRNDPLLEELNNQLLSFEEDGSLLNLTISRPHSSQPHSVIRHTRNHHLSIDGPLITSNGASEEHTLRDQRPIARTNRRHTRNHHHSINVPLITSDDASAGHSLGKQRPIVRTHRHSPGGGRRRHTRRQTRPHPPPEHYHKRHEPPSRRYRAQYRSGVRPSMSDQTQQAQKQPRQELASSPSDHPTSIRNNTAIESKSDENRRVQHPQRTSHHRARNPHYEFAPFPPLSPPLSLNSHQPTGRQYHGRPQSDPNYHPIVQHIFPPIDHRVEYLQPLSTPRPPPPYPPVIPRLQISNRIDPPIPPHPQYHHQQHEVQQQQQQHQHQQGRQDQQNEYQQQQQQQEQVAQEDHKSEEEDQDEGSSMLRGADDLRVGKALNIFSRYGFLTLSVKVRPPVGEDNFLFLENTAEVFQRNSYWGKRETRRHRGNYDDHFYIHFCENLNELLIAYFDHFTIEGVPKAHKAFTSSLSVRDLARQFGISYSFLNGHFSFVLVRLFRRRRRSTLQGPLEMQGSLRQALEDVRVGSAESVHQFVDRFGSHVITEFEVGDMMYQTFVFGERLYKELKNKFAVVTTSENHLEELQLYFTPNYATSVGSVLLASGNDELNRILETAASPELLLYPNIFRMFENPTLEAELEKLDGEVVLSLKLDKITSRLPRTPETRWVSEVLDTTLAIYYQHMASTRKNT